MNFAYYRNKSGMTQEQVANALGLRKKTYQNYEYEVRRQTQTFFVHLPTYTTYRSTIWLGEIRYQQKMTHQ